MAKSIAMMADEILNGALTNPSKEAVFESQGEDKLPELTDDQRNVLLGESLEVIDELDVSQPAERDPEQMRKKAEWEKKNREKRKAQRMARTVRGARNEPGEEQRQQRHRAGRGQKKGQAGHVDTRSKTSGSIGNAPHWRGEVEKTKKGTSTDLMSTPAGTKLAKKFHKDTINKSRKARGATELAGVQYMKTGKTMTLIDGKDKDWIQDAEADIKRRGTEGKCTPITKPGCTGKAKALAKTFKKMAKKRDDSIESKEEKAAKNESMWQNMKPEDIEILNKAKEIIDEMTSVGSIGVNMQGSANKAYDNNAKPMGQDNVKVAPVGKEMRSVKREVPKPVAKKKKKGKLAKESFENFLDSVISEAQRCS